MACLQGQAIGKGAEGHGELSDDRRDAFAYGRGWASIICTFPSGFYSAKILPVVGYDKAIRWERRALKSPLLGASALISCTSRLWRK